MNPSLSRRLVSEFIGTAFLLAGIVGSGIMAETLAGSANAVALLANSIAVGGILYVLIEAIGPVSGAHFNPVVTLAFALRREISVSDGLWYVVMQFTGGIAGVLVAHMMFEQDVMQYSEKLRSGGGQWIAEAVATFGLVFIIFAVLRSRPQAVPQAVALYIVAAFWFTASTSFANPAVSVARALSNTFAGIRPEDVPAFILAQCFGAVLAWAYCRWLYADNAATVAANAR